MKGVIVMCLEKMIEKQFGRQPWKEIMEEAGFKGSSVFLAGQDVPDEGVIKLIGTACKVLNLTIEQAAEAFGVFWVNEFAPRIYKTYYRGIKTAKDFIYRLNEVHDEVTQLIANAHPPSFEFVEEGDRSFLMMYKSGRGLIDIMIGLIRGVAVYFNEKVTTLKLNDTAVRVSLEAAVPVGTGRGSDRIAR